MKFGIYSTLKTLRKLGTERHFINLTNDINKNLQLILLTSRKRQNVFFNFFYSNCTGRARRRAMVGQTDE